MLENKIWIFFSDTGGGHRSAAEAIAAAMHELSPEDGKNDDLRLITDSVAERSHPINKFMVDLYNYLLCHRQSWMKYYYQLLHILKPNDSYIAYQLVKPFLNGLFSTEQPKVIVSVHPMLNHMFVRTRKNNPALKGVKLIEVVTDPNRELWKAWACEGMDLTIVPNDLVRNRLIEWGVAPEKIRVLGMPVHPDFLRPPAISRKEFFTSLNLDPDKLTICINAGWAGGGNMMKVYEQLASVNRPVQALFLCGHNDGLYKDVMEKVRYSLVKTVVLPFHNSMVDVMSHSDLMVTKAGGLTTFEAIAKRLPIAFDALTEPMPQEKGTIDMLLNQKLAHVIKKPEDIIGIIEKLEPKLDEDRMKMALPAAHSLDQTFASYNIAKLLAVACEPANDLVFTATPPLVVGENNIPVPGWEHVPTLGFETP